MNNVMATGIDEGGEATKVETVNADGKTTTVKDSAGNEIFRSAVYRDPKTQTYHYSDEAMNAGMFDRENLAIDWKRHLGDPAKRFFGGTASAKDVTEIFSRHLRECVTAAAGQAVDDCCVTFPQNFPDVAKRDLIEAVELAGWKIIAPGRGGMGQLTEPVAAALAYGDQNLLNSTGAKVLVVDVGSTTTDVCYVEFASGDAVVLGAHGEHELGAHDIRVDLFDLVIKTAKKTGLLREADLEKLKTIEGLEPELQRSAEGAMKALANRADTRIPIAFGSKPGFVTITREQYEREVLEPHIKRILACIDTAKSNAKESGKLPDGAKIDYLLPVGGPCRSPYIQRRIAEHTGLTPRVDLDQQRASVIGAARHAFWLKAQRDEKQWHLPGIIRPKEVVPWDIGVMTKESPDGPMQSLVLIEKGQPAPRTITKRLFLLHAHQTAVTCPFVQCDGNGQPTEACHPLSSVVLYELPPEVVRTARIEITATFNDVGMVTIEVVDLISKQRKDTQFPTKSTEQAAA